VSYTTADKVSDILAGLNEMTGANSKVGIVTSLEGKGVTIAEPKSWVDVQHAIDDLELKPYGVGDFLGANQVNLVEPQTGQKFNPGPALSAAGYNFCSGCVIAEDGYMYAVVGNTSTTVHLAKLNNTIVATRDLKTDFGIQYYSIRKMLVNDKDGQIIIVLQTSSSCTNGLAIKVFNHSLQTVREIAIPSSNAYVGFGEIVKQYEGDNSKLYLIGYNNGPYALWEIDILTGATTTLCSNLGNVMSAGFSDADSRLEAIIVTKDGVRYLHIVYRYSTSQARYCCINMSTMTQAVNVLLNSKPATNGYAIGYSPTYDRLYMSYSYINATEYENIRLYVVVPIAGSIEQSYDETTGSDFGYVHAIDYSNGRMLLAVQNMSGWGSKVWGFKTKNIPTDAMSSDITTYPGVTADYDSYLTFNGNLGIISPLNGRSLYCTNFYVQDRYQIIS
jgi:hypothetical protein